MKILYIEDDPFDADLTRRALAKTAPHIQIEVARTQMEALEFLELMRADPAGQAYDLMLTDLRLPDGSGFALLAHVREQNLPLAVVVITGQGDEEIAVSVLKAGADDYLVKRQDYLDHLALTLENALMRYRAETARRERPLRVLYLENNPGDIEITRQHFATHAPHIHLDIVYSSGQVFSKLNSGADGEKAGAMEDDFLPEYDAVMLETHHHDLDALDLLKELRQVRGLDLPIVLVTGHGDDELAAQALRLGASDYVVKNPGYLIRLPGLLENAYHRAQLAREQAALKASEERFRRLAENAPDIIYRFRVAPDTRLEYVSPAIQTLTGYSPESLYSSTNPLIELIHPDDTALFHDILRGRFPRGVPVAFRMFRKDGAILWAEVRNAPIYDEDGKLVANEGIVRDITERKQAEEQIQRQLQRLNALRMVDNAINRDPNLKITLNVLLDHVILQLGVHAADVLLYNPESQLFEYSAGIGFRTHTVEGMRARMGEGRAGQAALQQRTIHIPDYTALDGMADFHPLLAGEGFVAYFGTPLVAKGQVKGVLEIFHRRPLHPDPEWLNFLETLAGQAAIAIDNAELFDHLRQTNLELTLSYHRTLEGWVRFLDLRDKETQDHTQRVTDMTVRLAQVMGIEDSALEHIRRGALLHDVGKMGIPDSILHKPGPLTEQEWEIMRKHPQFAFDILSPIDYLRRAMEIPYCHHEWWDGNGYPQGLKGEQIPLAARIFAVVDVWDALSSDRSYRKKWQPASVLEYIRSKAGTQFDPQVVHVFLNLVTQSDQERNPSIAIEKNSQE